MIKLIKSYFDSKNEDTLAFRVWQKNCRLYNDQFEILEQKIIKLQKRIDELERINTLYGLSK